MNQFEEEFSQALAQLSRDFYEKTWHHPGGRFTFKCVK